MGLQSSNGDTQKTKPAFPAPSPGHHRQQKICSCKKACCTHEQQWALQMLATEVFNILARRKSRVDWVDVSACSSTVTKLKISNFWRPRSSHLILRDQQTANHFQASASNEASRSKRRGKHQLRLRIVGERYQKN